MTLRTARLLKLRISGFVTERCLLAGYKQIYGKTLQPHDLTPLWAFINKTRKIHYYKGL